MITEKEKKSTEQDLRDELGRITPSANTVLEEIRRNAVLDFTHYGIPTAKNEEWKYTRIAPLFEHDFRLGAASRIHEDFLDTVKLPGHEQANVLVFVNGVFTPDFSVLRSRELSVLPFTEALEHPQHQHFIEHYTGHAGNYLHDGLYALNSAFVQNSVLISTEKGRETGHPLYIYHITDAGSEAALHNPRLLIRLSEASSLTLAETYISVGDTESLTNQVTEVVTETDARLEFYRMQNDGPQASQVNTTHIRQVGKSVVNTVTISVGGKLIRNNLHAILEAEHAEAHLYGLYFQRGKSHVDNHTIVDNTVPHSLSNELYKGVLDDQSSGVFNGKVFVRKDAQKTNAFQSNKNILLSDTATVNTKPQLEIFADDVKCSHGCTIGSLDQEALFYLQSRGIPHASATALLLQGFAMDVLEKIRLEPIRLYAQELLVQQLRKEER